MNDENIKISNLLKANIFIIKTAIEEVIGMEINDRTKRRPIPYSRKIFLKIAIDEFGYLISQKALFFNFLPDFDRSITPYSYKTITDLIQTSKEVKQLYDKCIERYQELLSLNSTKELFKNAKIDEDMEVTNNILLLIDSFQSKKALKKINDKIKLKLKDLN